MATSSKIDDAAARAKQAASEQKGGLEEAARKAQAAAKTHGGEAQERLAQAREHRPHGKSKQA